jgi:deoxycytidine triphosphate deaminase
MSYSTAILTKREIQAYMDPDRPIGNRLYVSPFFEHEQLGDTSIDLRLGQRFLVSEPSRAGEIDIADLSRGGREILRDNYDEIRIRIGGHFTLHPGESVQVGTMEYLGIPNDLQGSVALRKSVSDLLITANEVRVHPGHRGIVTLTLTSNADIAVKLRPGVRIAELMLQGTQTAILTPKSSRYHAITEPTPSLFSADRDLRYVGPRIEPVIVGIVSTIASGRSIALSVLRLKGFTEYSLASKLREDAEWRGIKPTRENLQALGQHLRARYGDGYLAERLRNDQTWLICKSGLIVVDSFKTIAEFEEFAKQKHFTLLGINAAQAERWKRVQARERQTEPTNYEGFIVQDETDRGLRGIPHGQEVDRLLKKAHHVVISDRGEAEFRNDIGMFADRLLHPAIPKQEAT